MVQTALDRLNQEQRRLSGLKNKRGVLMNTLRNSRDGETQTTEVLLAQINDQEATVEIWKMKENTEAAAKKKQKKRT